MSAGSAAARGRAAAARYGLFPDEFAAFEPTGTTTDADGMTAPVFTARGSVFGRCHAGVRLQSVTSTSTTVGGVERPVIDGGLRFPLAADPRIGWEYVLTVPGPETDPSLADRRWHVVGVQADSYATARRLNVVEVPA